MVKFPAGLAIAATMLVAAACGPRPPGGAAAQASAELPVWPPPPEPPRIRYVRSVSGPADFGIKPSFLQRLSDAVFGKRAGHFVRPAGVAERNGVLYVADPGARALWILDSQANRFVKVSRAGELTLMSPVALAVRPDGGVYLADSALKKVFLFDVEGRLSRLAAEQQLSRPAGLAYDAVHERLYVADSADHRIRVYDAKGALVHGWGRPGSGDGEFNRPTYLAFDRTGALLVTDALNFRVQAFDREGRFLWKLGRHGDGSGDFAAPKGATSDSEGHIYVVDALFDAVQVFRRDGTLLLAFGEQGTHAGQFWLPAGIFINGRDGIYVADAYNQRVQAFLFYAGQDEGERR